MARTAKKAPTNVIPIAATLESQQPYRGYVVHTAHADVGTWFPVSIFRQVDHDHGVYSDPADPLVTIDIDRRHAKYEGDPPRGSMDVIESIRAGDVDRLIEALTEALAAARANGMLPPRIARAAQREHSKARRDAIDEQAKQRQAAKAG